jgi:hypothetical protein
MHGRNLCKRDLQQNADRKTYPPGRDMDVNSA